MRRIAIVFGVLALCGGAFDAPASAAPIDQVKVNPDRGGDVGNPEFAAVFDCPADGFKSRERVENFVFDWFNAPCSLGGDVRLGPISFADAPATIQGVLVDVTMQHTWIADVSLKLVYDETCDGRDDAAAFLTGGYPNSECDFFVWSDLNGTYRFGNNAPLTVCEAAADLPPLEILSPGCYQPSELLTVFHGLQKNGCWYLDVCDGAPSDAGTIFVWRVLLDNDQATPVEATSWGAIKAIYNQ